MTARCLSQFIRWFNLKGAHFLVCVIYSYRFQVFILIVAQLIDDRSFPYITVTIICLNQLNYRPQNKMIKFQRLKFFILCQLL